MIELYLGDCLEVLKNIPNSSIHCCVTSPPYWGLRDYKNDMQLGLENTPEEYVNNMVKVFSEIRRVLRHDGTLWLNLGDTYSGSSNTGGTKSIQGSPKHIAAMTSKGTRRSSQINIKPKNLIGIPWRVAFALQSNGWFLRQDIIWHKGNPMPESVSDRCTKAHEYVFLFSKSEKYYFDSEAIKELSVQNNNQLSDIYTRNRRSVWTINTKPYPDAHYAVMPTELVKPCILAGTSEKGCCSKCGMPMKRIVSKKRIRRCELSKEDSHYRPNNYNSSYSEINGKSDAGYTVTTTLDWKLQCECVNNDIIPCTVLDPFSGSGTVGVVSTDLNRRYIGIELNSDYLALSEKRLNVVYDKPIIYR